MDEINDSFNSKSPVIFNIIWNMYIKPLEGEKLFTVTGCENVIMKVTNEHLVRLSSKGNEGKIDKRIFEDVYNRLLERNVITRKEIHEEHPSRVSSIVTAVLAQVPFIKIRDVKPIALILE